MGDGFTAATDEAGSRKSRKRRIWIPVTTGIAALLLGSGIGSAGATQEIEELTQSEQRLSAELDEARTQLAELESEVEEFESAHEKLETDYDELRKTADERASQLAGLKKEKRALETELSALEAAEVTVAPETVESPAAAPAPVAPAAYYQNCTEARNAGAAPLYSNSPGYGPHLDRDGDGVACE